MAIEKQWTKEQSDEIVRMRKDGISLRAIAEIFCCGKGSIINHLNKKNVSVGRIPFKKSSILLNQPTRDDDDPFPPGRPVTWGVISGNAPWPGYDNVMRLS